MSDKSKKALEIFKNMLLHFDYIIDISKDDIPPCQEYVGSCLIWAFKNQITASNNAYLFYSLNLYRANGIHNLGQLGKNKMRIQRV